MEAGSGAVVVEVAALVHGLLEGVILPAEDVVTVSSRATGKKHSLAGGSLGPSAACLKKSDTYPRSME